MEKDQILWIMKARDHYLLEKIMIEFVELAPKIHSYRQDNDKEEKKYKRYKKYAMKIKFKSNGYKKYFERKKKILKDEWKFRNKNYEVTNRKVN